MEFTGKVSGMSQDYLTGSLIISFTVNEKASVVSCYETIKDVEKLDIRAVRHREKRSLDANAYAWVLMSKIAAAIGSSKEDVYEEMLLRYGFLYEDEDGYITVTVKDHVDMSKIEGHWQLIRNNGMFKAYAMIKGSSKYDSKEMSRFIDGIVSEAKILGIETLPPAELERMTSAWTM